MTTMSEKIYAVFVSNLQAAMQSSGLSQSELARRLDVTPSYVSQLLSGHRRPGLDTLEKIARVLEMEPSDLLQKKVGHHC